MLYCLKQCIEGKNFPIEFLSTQKRTTVRKQEVKNTKKHHEFFGVIFNNTKKHYELTL